MPVAPSKIDITAQNKNTKLDLINGGELTLLKQSGNTEYKFTLLLPAKEYAFTTYSGIFLYPSYFQEIITDLKNRKSSFYFTVTDSSSRKYINTSVSLEDYAFSENSVGDISATITLKKYVHYSTKAISVSDKIIKPAPVTPEKEPDRETITPPTQVYDQYTIKSGDNLIFIARRFYGNDNKWIDIYNLNKELLDSVASSRGYPPESGDWWIFPGTKINLP